MKSNSNVIQMYQTECPMGLPSTHPTFHRFSTEIQINYSAEMVGIINHNILEAIFGQPIFEKRQNYW